MRMMRGLMAASTLVAAGLSAVAAHAAPLGGGGPGTAAAASIERLATVQKAAYRRCWIAGGVRHCRWFADPYDDDYYGDSSYYDDPGYYGYGPGIGFFFGGGRGHGFRGGHFHGGRGHGGGHFGGGHGGGRGGHR